MNTKLLVTLSAVLWAQTPRAAEGLDIDESTGVPSYTYRFDLPRARGRFQPTLALRHAGTTGWMYDKSDDETGQGTGWFVSLPYVETQGDETFQYVENGDATPLVASPREGSGHFARDVEIEYFDLTHPDATQWVGRDQLGNVWTFEDVAGTGKRWLLVAVTDLEGNDAKYTHGKVTGSSTMRLERIDYNKYESNGPQYATTVALEYVAGTGGADCNWKFYSPALKNVRIQTRNSSALVTTKRYELTMGCNIVFGPGDSRNSRSLDSIAEIGQESGPEKLVTTFGYAVGYGDASVMSSVVGPFGARTDLSFTNSSSLGFDYLNGLWVSYPVLTGLATSGLALQASTNHYWYSTPVVAANGEYRGFARTWKQDDLTRIVTSTLWETASHPFVGWARRIERGSQTVVGVPPELNSAGTPPQYKAFSSASFWNGVRYLSKSDCSMPSTMVSPAAGEPSEYPVFPYTQVEQSTATAGTYQRAVDCSAVDAFGNFEKITIDPDVNVSSNEYVIRATYEVGFNASASCKHCIRDSWKADGAGNRLEATHYTYGSTFLLEGIRAQIDATHVSTDAWPTVQSFTYYPNGNVETMTDANGVSHTYTYGDGFDLKVTKQVTSDAGGAKLVTETAYDVSGRPYQLTGPYIVSPASPTSLTFTTPDDQKLQRYIAYDSLGRRRIVARAPINGAELRSVIEAFRYHDFDPSAPSSLASVDAFGFAVPRDFTDPAIPLSSDVRQMTSYFDGLGREIQVRERLGGSGVIAAGTNIVQELSQYRVSKAVVLDAAGRIVAAADPYFSGSAQFVDVSSYSLDRLNPSDVVLATFTAYDEQGRVSCRTRRDFTAGPPGPVCSSNFATPGYTLATRILYRGVTVGAQGYLAVKRVAAENNVGGSAVGPETFYDAAGSPRWTTDAEGNTERRMYDLLGRATGFVREVSGNVNTPLASTVTLDMMGRVYRRIDPNVGTRRFEYDPARPALLAKVIFEKTGDEIHYDYDRGRIKTLSQCRAVSGTLTCSTDATYQYDVPWTTSYAHTEGRLAAAWSANTTIALSYDANGFVVRRDQSLPGFDESFSVLGTIREDGGVVQTSFSAPGWLSYGFSTSYDSVGRPVGIASGNTIHWSAPDVTANTGAYDATGKLGLVTFDAGAVQHSWTYQPYSGLESAESLAFTGGAAQTIYSVDSMTYQGTKLKSYRDVLNQTEQGFWYSDAGRLVSSRTRAVGATTNTALLCMGYSTSNKFGPGPSFGNIELAREAGVTTDYVYSGTGVEGTPQAGPDAVTSVGSTLVEYDSYGRISRTAGGTEAFGYDLLNRLTSISRASGTSEVIDYDPLGGIMSRQTGTAVTYYIGPHATVRGTIQANCAAPPCALDPTTVNVDVHLLVGGERIGSVRVGPGGPSRTAYIHRDRLGSVIATTLSGGAAGASYRYSAHGVLQSASGETTATASELGYAGALRLSGGLLLMGIRVYYPALRAFIQPDPLAPFSYTYVRGDPINHVDPTGMTTDAPPHQCTGGGDTNCSPPPPPSSRGNDYTQTIWINPPVTSSDLRVGTTDGGQTGIFVDETSGTVTVIYDPAVGQAAMNVSPGGILNVDYGDGTWGSMSIGSTSSAGWYYMAGAGANAIFGASTSAVEHFSGAARIGSNLKLYRPGVSGRVWRGNQYVKTFSLAKAARALGWLSVGIGTAMDATNPEVSAGKMLLNLGIGIAGVVGSAPVAVCAAVYFGVDAFYEGGWDGLLTDVGNLHY